jgi:hypothetical protein
MNYYNTLKFHLLLLYSMQIVFDHSKIMVILFFGHFYSQNGLCILLLKAPICGCV